MDRRELAGAAGSAAVSVVNILVGFGFQAVLAAQLGTGPLADVFSSGVTVATLLATAIAAAGVSVLVPALEARRQSGPHGLQRQDLRHLVLLGGVASLLLAAAAPVLARVLAPASIESTTELAVFIAITSVVPLLAMLTVVGQADCLVRREYRRAAAVGLVNGLLLLGTTLVLSLTGGLTSEGLAVAVVVGYLAQAAWMARPLRRAVASLPTGTRTGTDAPRALLQLGATSALAKSQPFIERLIGAGLVAGTTAALGYANKITAALVFAASMGLQGIALPRLSELVHAGSRDAATGHLRRTLEITWWPTVAVVGFTVWSAPALVFALFGRGEFTAETAAATALLVVGSLGMVAFGALTGPIVNVLYASRSRHTVTAVAIGSTLVGGLVSWWLAGAVGPVGITLGTSVGMAVGMVAFSIRAAARLGSWSWLPRGLELVAVLGGLVVAVASGWAAGALIPVEVAGRATWVDLVLVGLRFGVVLICVGVWAAASWAPARDLVVGRWKAVLP